MLNKVLSTPVDDLVELIKKNPNSSLSYIQKTLKVSLDIIEKWIIILEEFEVLTIKYKGFEGYVSLHPKKKSTKKKNLDLDKIKDHFIEKSKVKNYSFEKMRSLWPLFLEEYKVQIKDQFYKKAESAGYQADKVKIAWNKYEKILGEF